MGSLDPSGSGHLQFSIAYYTLDDAQYAIDGLFLSFFYVKSR